MTKVLSASQVSTFGTFAFGGNTRGCPRRWAFKYLTKLPDDAGQYAQAGKLLHELLEEYLLWPGTGPKPRILTLKTKEAKTARAMLGLLPSPPQTRVEEPFECEIDGIKWRGVKDLVFYDGPILVVHDHKSTSSLAWVKHPDDLRRDVQSIIYARDAFGESDVVDLEWLYGTREETPQVEQVRFNITFDEVQAGLPPIIGAGKRILELYKEAPDPCKLEKSLDSCYAFGKPCPFMGPCGLTLTEQCKALYIQYLIKEEKRMGFRDRVKVTEVQQLTTEPINKPSMAEKLGFGSSITPPPFVKDTSRGEDITPQYEEKVPEAPPVSAESVAAEEAPKRRGRPPGTKNKAKDTAVVVTEDGTRIMGDPAAVAEMAKALVPPPAQTPPGFTLLVNTVPVGYAYTNFSEYVRPVLDTVNARNQVEHYRQIDYKGGAMLAAELYSYLQTNPPTGYLFVDKTTDEGRDCLPTLERFAKVVFRGV